MGEIFRTSFADSVVVTVVYTVIVCVGRGGSQRTEHSSSLTPDGSAS